MREKLVEKNRHGVILNTRCDKNVQKSDTMTNSIKNVNRHTQVWIQMQIRVFG